MSVLDKDLKQVLTVFAVVISFGGGYFLCQSENKDAIRIGEKFADFKKVEEHLGENVYITNDEDYAVQEAINGYYRGLGDRYFSYKKQGTIYSVESEINSSNMLIHGGFEIMANVDGNIFVKRVDKDSYAEQMGLRKYDIITKIDETVIAEKGFLKSARKLLGKSGTESVFTIIRNGKEMTLTYVRAHEKKELNTFSVIDDICYISYEYFSTNTADIFDKAIEKHDNDVKGYIIDLRNNPGGDTNVCMEVIGKFIGERRVCDFHYINGKEEKFFSQGEKKISKPVAVLLNERSASSSEIFASAMVQFYENDVVLVGTNTLGKGTFQITTMLFDLNEIKSTDGYFTVGDWPCFQDSGIAPDIEVKMDSSLIGTKDDVQLEAAIEWLN